MFFFSITSNKVKITAFIKKQGCLRLYVAKLYEIGKAKNLSCTNGQSNLKRRCYVFIK